MYNTTMAQPDPQIFIEQFASWEVSAKANKWQSRNITRFVNAEFDKTHKSAESELDPVKRAAMFVRMNEILIEQKAVIPIVNRPVVSAHSSRLRAPMSGWDNDVWLARDWFREG
jgi:peptide/nickel transport system substrate-binding protein